RSGTLPRRPRRDRPLPLERRGAARPAGPRGRAGPRARRGDLRGGAERPAARVHARRRAAAPPPRGPRAPRAHGLRVRVRARRGRGLRRSRRAGTCVRDHGWVSDGTLILLRHGESVFNAASIFTGLLDVDVSERGREQARAAGRLIAASRLTPEQVWTS